MTPPRTREFFRRILESIRLAVHGGSCHRGIHVVSLTTRSIDPHPRATFASTISACWNRPFAFLHRHNIFSFPLLIVLVAMIICHQAFELSGPTRLIIGARGCAIGALMCACINYLIAIAHSLGHDSD